MLEEKAVLYEADSGVGAIVLNNPTKLNAVSQRLSSDLALAVGQAIDDRTVKVITLTGNGRSFCAGADLSDPDTHSADDLVGFLDSVRGGLSMLQDSPKPVVVGTHGWAVGAGVEMVLAADIAIAAEDARFSLPQVSLGIVPGAGGMSRLARTVGVAWARRLVLLGERIDASAAISIGLVTEITSSSSLRARVREVADALAKAPPASVILAREGIAAANEMPLSAALRTDQYRLYMLSGTEEKDAAHSEFRVRKAHAD